MDLQDATEKHRFVVQTVVCAAQDFPPLPENTREFQIENVLNLLFSHAVLPKSAPSPTVIMI